MLPAVEAWSFNHWTAREVPMWSFFLTIIYLLAVLAFIAASRLSLGAASRGCSLVSVAVLLILAASPLEHRLWACGLQLLPHMHSLSSCGTGLSCPSACEIFPDQGSNALAGRFFITGPPEKVPIVVLSKWVKHFEKLPKLNEYILYSAQSVSCVRLFATSWSAAARLPCPSPTHGACSNSSPSSW